MKSLRILLLMLLVTLSTALLAQEHGPVLGGSLGTLHEKVNVITSNFGGYKLHYHVGYAYRQYLGDKFAIDGIALFGSQGTDYEFYLQDAPKTEFHSKNYLSLGTIVSYECFRNFRIGVGADFAYYIGRFGNASFNDKKVTLDVPLSARVSYSFNWLELQLTYKHGMCDLIKNNYWGKITSRDIQFSIFVPLFKK